MSRSFLTKTAGRLCAALAVGFAAASTAAYWHGSTHVRSVTTANLYSDVDLFVFDHQRALLAQVNETEGWDGTPSLSPDGRYIAFASNRGGDTDLYLTDFSGSIRRLTSSHYNERAPDWSPDGSQIVYQFEASTQSGLFIVDVTSGETQRLTTGTHLDPAWSPDGRFIAYTVNLYLNTPAIWLLDLQTRVERLLLGGDSYSYLAPSWSPDGRRLALVSNRESRDHELYLYHLDTDQLERLTNAPYMDVNPIWHPDGARLIFESWRGGGPGLYYLEDEFGIFTHLTRIK